MVDLMEIRIYNASNLLRPAVCVIREHSFTRKAMELTNLIVGAIVRNRDEINKSFSDMDRFSDVVTFLVTYAAREGGFLLAPWCGGELDKLEDGGFFIETREDYRSYTKLFLAANSRWETILCIDNYPSMTWNKSDGLVVSTTDSMGYLSSVSPRAGKAGFVDITISAGGFANITFKVLKKCTATKVDENIFWITSEALGRFKGGMTEETWNYFVSVWKEAFENDKIGIGSRSSGEALLET